MAVISRYGSLTLVLAAALHAGAAARAIKFGKLWDGHQVMPHTHITDIGVASRVPLPYISYGATLRLQSFWRYRMRGRRWRPALRRFAI